MYRGDRSECRSPAHEIKYGAWAAESCRGGCERRGRWAVMGKAKAARNPEPLKKPLHYFPFCATMRLSRRIELAGRGVLVTPHVPMRVSEPLTQ